MKRWFRFWQDSVRFHHYILSAVQPKLYERLLVAAGSSPTQAVLCSEAKRWLFSLVRS